jgi:hypothetical protein
MPAAAGQLVSWPDLGPVTASAVTTNPNFGPRLLRRTKFWFPGGAPLAAPLGCRLRESLPRVDPEVNTRADMPDTRAVTET